MKASHENVFTIDSIQKSGAIICSFALEEHCRKSYPKRRIFPDMYLRHEEFFVFGKRGMYIVMNKTEIWVGDWPYIVRRR